MRGSKGAHLAQWLTPHMPSAAFRDMTINAVDQYRDVCGLLAKSQEVWQQGRPPGPLPRPHASTAS